MASLTLTRPVYPSPIHFDTVLHGIGIAVIALALCGCSNVQRDGLAISSSPPDTAYTVIISGGRIYDGTGQPAVQADVGLVGDRLVAFGDLSSFDAELRLDVDGLAVVPGFIDIHSHAAGNTVRGSGLYRYPDAENYLRQGVTTAIVGQDGTSAYPIDEFLNAMAERPAAINLGTMVGHGTVRAMAMGNSDREPTSAERDRMKAMVEAAMQDGAFGLSSGLEYTPGAYAETEELIDLARVVEPFDGIYISHIRNEGGQLLESVAETIRIGEESGVAPQITHHKVVGNGRWGQSEASLELLEEARDRGVNAMSDVYPYTASSTGINILFPSWSKEGSRADRLERLRDPEKRIYIRNDIIEHIETERGGDPSTIFIANCSWNRALNGKSLAQILEEDGKPPTVVQAAELAMELEENGGCMGVFHSMSEDDVTRIMAHPTTMIASDGGVPGFGHGAPHPRNYGTFARVLARYVRDMDVLAVSEAVHKMAGMPAQRLGLADRGVLRAGALADIAVLDLESVQDHATFEEPHQYATGVKHVFVAGIPVLLDGALTGNRPGRVLRKTLQRP